MLEQNFQFDLVSTDKAAAEVHRPADHRRARASATSVDDRQWHAAVVDRWSGAARRMTARSSRCATTRRCAFPELPGGLNTRPTLVWDIQSPRAGDQRSARHLSDRRCHLVGGLQPDLQRGQGREQRHSRPLRVGQHHQSVGRDVSRTQAEADRRRRASRRARRAVPMVEARLEMADAMAAAAPPGFEEKSFFEFHLYTLGRPHHAAEQLHQADRALRPGEADSGEESRWSTTGCGHAVLLSQAR